MSFPAQPDALPVMDPSRYLHLESALFDYTARTVAFFTCVLDELPRARAGGTRPSAYELPEDAARNLANAPAASAGRAGTDLGVGLGAVPTATLTRNSDAEGHLALRSGCHLGEVDLDPCGNVGAAGATPASPSSAEQVVAEKREEEIREAAEVERGRDQIGRAS